VKRVLTALLLLLTSGLRSVWAGPEQRPSVTPVIIDRPIRFDEERVKLTLQYRRVHQDAAARDTSITPRVIVLHYTGGQSFQSTWQYFNRLKAEASRKSLLRAGAVNVSAHFVIDQDGTIYRLVPETTMARHVIGLNHVSIGIENVGNDKTLPLTEAQVTANVALIRYLAGRYAITHLIGHQEADQMRGHAYYLENDPSYRNTHDDPGKRFMARVRAQLGDLALEGPPVRP